MKLRRLVTKKISGVVVALPLLLGTVTAGTTMITLDIQPAKAAYLENTLKNFIDNPDIDETFKNNIRSIMAFVYMIPLIAIILSAGGLVFAHKQGEQAWQGAITVISVIWVVLLCAGFYDAKFVTNVNTAGTGGRAPGTGGGQLFNSLPPTPQLPRFAAVFLLDSLVKV